MDPENEILKSIDEKADKEFQLRLQRNTFIREVLKKLVVV